MTRVEIGTPVEGFDNPVSDIPAPSIGATALAPSEIVRGRRGYFPRRSTSNHESSSRTTDRSLFRVKTWDV
jgi:hypothetical protein